jgi:D-alanyl-D-alanine carboxypeptidase/D-alanyl-D-alanine-endopeptidase (penicillin-binding protein 4)
MISRAGIRAIEGDLAGDVSRFDSIAWGRGWMWDDEPSSDFAYVTPLSVSHNAVEIRVAPGAKTGHEPALSVAPATEGLVMFNTAVTTADTLVPPLTADRLHGTNTFRVAGRIAPGDTAERLEVSVWQPERWCLELLRERLAARGVSVRGACTIWTTPPPGFDTIASVSRSLDTVLAAVNKESDNLAAELLLKTIAAESGRRPGTSAAGIAIVKEYLAGVGVDTSAVQMADGSGVSFYNEVSPEALLGLLQAEYSQPATFARFRASLPVAGVDGTLRGRMKGTRAQGNAAAKTGTLTGVSTISGYLTSADGRPVAFCILASHFPGPAGAVRALQNEIIALLAQTEIGPRR